LRINTCWCTFVHTIHVIDYEWDPAKEWANRKKHGVAFADAVIALEDELALTKRDANGREETRFLSLARDAQDRLLVPVFTFRGDRIRIISTRRATPRQRRHYENRP